MSNCAYFASRTPSATFSKSQKTARLRASWLPGMRSMSAGRTVQPSLQALEVEADDRRDVVLKHLRKEQPADPREPERRGGAAPGAEADGDRQPAHQRRHGGHHDRTEAYQ